jgi:molybdopterin molybdotransferase
MPEFLTLLPPAEARTILLSHLAGPLVDVEFLDSKSAIGRTVGDDIQAPHPLPEFLRSMVDGYAVRAVDTFGAGDSLPAYLEMVGEIPMGSRPSVQLGSAQCALIHTGGMLPDGADAVVMVENSQAYRQNEVEITHSVAAGENVIQIGEDVKQGQLVIRRGKLLREAEIGGLMALGIIQLPVIRKPIIGLISCGDEIVDPGESSLEKGLVRDINSYTLASLFTHAGAQPVLYGIVKDDFTVLLSVAQKALDECDAVVITAGSSASTRDRTAEIIGSLGSPGVLVHGINTRPGKPTILGVVNGKAVIGLPGNPVSALVNGFLFVVPVLDKLLGALPRHKPSILARLTVNLPSQAGREDWLPVRLISPSPGRESILLADPVFGKSNLIFTLVDADGLIRIPTDSTGLAANEIVEVILI